MKLELLILIGMSAMLLAASCVIVFVFMYQKRVIRHQRELEDISQQRELERIQAGIQAEEQERMRIASEIHDDLGATMATAKMLIASAAATYPDSDILSKSDELLTSCMSRIRSISQALHPSTLSYLGLDVCIESMVEAINQSETINATFVVHDIVPRFSNSTELSLYRIIQELISNMLKHSSASYLEIVISRLSGSCSIALNHDGKGLNQRQFEELTYKKGALGLKNIVNRLKSINGEILFSKEENRNSVTIIIKA